VVLIFSAFMVGNSLRFVTLNTLVSKVPEPGVRAQFTSLLSAVQHAASAGAAMLSTLLLSEGEGHQLIGVPLLASLALGLSVIMVVVVMSIQIQVKGRAAVAIVTEAH
jgi:hypothetical protein